MIGQSVVGDGSLARSTCCRMPVYVTRQEVLTKSGSCLGFIKRTGDCEYVWVYWCAKCGNVRHEQMEDPELLKGAA